MKIKRNTVYAVPTEDAYHRFEHFNQLEEIYIPYNMIKNIIDSGREMYFLFKGDRWYFFHDTPTHDYYTSRYPEVRFRS